MGGRVTFAAGVYLRLMEVRYLRFMVISRVKPCSGRLVMVPGDLISSRELDYCTRVVKHCSWEVAKCSV